MQVTSLLLVIILHSEVLAETSNSTPAKKTLMYPVKGAGCPFGAKQSCPVSLLAGRGEPSPISFTACAKSCSDVPALDNDDVHAWTNGLWAKHLSFKNDYDRKPSEILSDFAKLEHIIDGMQAGEKSTFDLMSNWIDSEHVDGSQKALLKSTGHSTSPLIERASWPPYAEKPWKGKLIVIVGGGPIGMRMAVEALLLGADVTIGDARDGWTRANVMKMWPVAKHDLESIGLKEFTLLSGDAPICNIAVMQHALLRIALVLGANVEIMKFKELKFVKDGMKYGAVFEKDGKELPPIDFDAIFDASGVGGALVSSKVSGEPIFKRDSDSSGGQRVAITANFERFKADKDKDWAFGQTSITAVGAKYLDDKQKYKVKPKVELRDLVWFQSVLSNYVVMAMDIDEIQAKYPKAFKDNNANRSQLLGRKNIDYDELLKLVLSVAEDWKIPFEKSGGAPKMLDGINKLAIFDFMGGAISRDPARDKTSMIQELPNQDQYVVAIGDSLRAPFWPEGTGMSRGILSVLHAGFILNKIWTQQVYLPDQLDDADSWAHLAAYAQGTQCKGKCGDAAVKEYVLRGYRGDAPPRDFGDWM